MLKRVLYFTSLVLLFSPAYNQGSQPIQGQLLTTSMPAGIGNSDEPLAGLNILMGEDPGRLISMTLELTGTTCHQDIREIRVYAQDTLLQPDLGTARLFGSAGSSEKFIRISGEQALKTGKNIFWITADISREAQEGNQIGARIISYEVSGAGEVMLNGTSAQRTLLLTVKRLYRPGDNGSTSYRIPAIITATDGSLVTATDRRWNGTGDLPNHIDVMINRSTDLGKTWSAGHMIAGAGTDTGYGDPALVLNRKNGDLICLFVSHSGLWTSTADNPIRINQSVSHDHGLTWSEPEDLTDQIYGAGCPHPVTRDWQAAFVTSGAALQLTSGRLMAVLAVRETTDNTISNFVMYSDDHGASWQVSTNRACSAGDEAKMTELADGRVLMSIRHRGHRLFSWSSDQGLSWSEPVDQTAITDPFCNGDLIRYTLKSEGYSKNRLLHSIPFAESRTNVSVLMSYDEGETWPVMKSICPGPSAYSALTILPDGTIGMYLEAGEFAVYDMYFVRFSLEWLSDQQDQLN